MHMLLKEKCGSSVSIKIKTVAPPNQALIVRRRLNKLEKLLDTLLLVLVSQRIKYHKTYTLIGNLRSSSCTIQVGQITGT